MNIDHVDTFLGAKGGRHVFGMEASDLCYPNNERHNVLVVASTSSMSDVGARRRYREQGRFMQYTMPSRRPNWGKSWLQTVTTSSLPAGNLQVRLPYRIVPESLKTLQSGR